ncbi:hypothetical protein DFJ58DRAFT_844399 [Suillus subalutaceus]|uniref:uncharacterized protein n=1 Tax=Suillus subalutaceus TaxID=48586 RepID=UPI001B875A0C|nr:uncharacterized protein DFJ58DRAFT_844399 [Suillus subalutaceus]KAG1843290.1 hypothetical protein DFJ58DRAFT_844399 [Suillus subalutaceus]
MVSGASSTTGMRGRTRSKRDASHGLGQGYQMTSWIWFASGVQDDETDAGSERCLACADNWWNEEVLLLKEGMQQTRQFLAWHVQQWQSVTELSHQDAQIVAGAVAYAHRQAAGTGVGADVPAAEDEVNEYFAEDEDNFDDEEG